MDKWSTTKSVTFEQTFYDRIKEVVGDLVGIGRKSDSGKDYSYDYRNFAGSKIKKLHLGGVMRVYADGQARARTATCGIHPEDSFDIPRFACLWSERRDRLMIIVDLHPAKDVILYPKYIEKYLKPLYPIVNKAQEIPGFQREAIIPNPRQYPLSTQFSRYSIHGRFVIEQTERFWELARKYLEVWLEGWKKAEMMTDLEELKYTQQRRDMMSEAYRRLDPGARLWIRIGGEKLAKEMQDFSW